ncbi:hypothetical protein [Nocardia puris]|uniref:Uncharacterized protein n=1 Tax=Nocardia puris TaxID=208602 RepID=A0A366DMP0_9NOCA|nr:hypothetical protein [Nocardia puris]RBO91363.1 hypothetical protein DFR74_10465 [Nocardia puris]
MATLLEATIADQREGGATFVVSEADDRGERYFVRTDSHDWDYDAFVNARRAAVIELPDAERSPLGGTWYPKGSEGRGIRIATDQVDDLIAVGALAMAIKLQLSAPPTLTEDLTAILTNPRTQDPAIDAAIERVRTAWAAGRITLTGK